MNPEGNGIEGICGGNVEGNVVVPKPYMVVNRTPVTSDGKTATAEEQIKARENANHWLRKTWISHTTHHPSTTSNTSQHKDQDLKTAKEMWDQVKSDATTESTLYLLDVEDEVASMKLGDTKDLKTHLAEHEEHFQLMVTMVQQSHCNGSALSNSHYQTIIMHSLPGSYWPALQDNTAAERASAASGAQVVAKWSLMIWWTSLLKKHSIESLIPSIWRILTPCWQCMGRKASEVMGNRGEKSKGSVTCENCGKPRHAKLDCYSKGGGKKVRVRGKEMQEGQEEDQQIGCCSQGWWWGALRIHVYFRLHCHCWCSWTPKRQTLGLHFIAVQVVTIAPTKPNSKTTDLSITTILPQWTDGLSRQLVLVMFHIELPKALSKCLHYWRMLSILQKWPSHLSQLAVSTKQMCCVNFQKGMCMIHCPTSKLFSQRCSIFFKLYGHFWHFKSLDYDQEKLEIGKKTCFLLAIIIIQGISDIFYSI